MRFTEKMKAFCRAYMGQAQGDGAEAARLAGYSKKCARVTASKLLKRDEIQEHLETLRAKARQEAIKTHEDCCAVLSALVDAEDIPAARTASEATQIAGVRIRAIETLAKLRGYNAPEKAELEQKHTGTITYECVLVEGRQDVRTKIDETEPAGHTPGAGRMPGADS